MRFRKRPVQFSEAPDSQRPQELGQVGNDSKENGNQRSQAPHGSGILPDKQLNGNGRQALTAVSAIEQNRAVSVSCKLLMTFAQHKESRQLSRVFKSELFRAIEEYEETADGVCAANTIFAFIVCRLFLQLCLLRGEGGLAEAAIHPGQTIVPFRPGGP
jgi:hypothetical protein